MFQTWGELQAQSLSSFMPLGMFSPLPKPRQQHHKKLWINPPSTSCIKSPQARAGVGDSGNCARWPCKAWGFSPANSASVFQSLSDRSACSPGAHSVNPQETFQTVNQKLVLVELILCFPSLISTAPAEACPAQFKETLETWFPTAQS